LESCGSIMTKTPYEVLLRLNSDGSIAGASIRYLLEVEGRVIEGDPEPLAGTSDPAFLSFKSEFSAGVIAQRDDLLIKLELAYARIAELITQVNFDPRTIEANAFLNRITSTELAQLFSSDDPNVQAISQMLLAYKSNDWRIELDSVEMRQAVGYLRSFGMVTDERAGALLQDGTRAEAYIDDGSD